MHRWRTIRRATKFVVPPSGGRGGSHVVPSRLKAELRAAFTLIEMLVAVTLVLMMMVMFGEIFQLASGSVTKQRIMADNDQNVRTFITVLRADLDKRTFRTLVPFFPGELSSNPGTPFEKRRGYFYISNNNISDGTDDLLQFTVDSTVTLRNSDESLYFGHAVPLTGTSLAAFVANPNQPDRDDGQISINYAGASKAAEISYWMRAGKIYRRAMVIRDPIKGAGVSTDPVRADQPADASGNDFFAGSYGGNFWNDFDYSAHRLSGSLATAISLPVNARFNGVDYLSNDQSILPHSPHPFIYSLGQTWNRFGHNHEIFPVTSANGLPREYSAAATPNFFMGRFTQEETSSTEDLNGNGVLDPGEDTNSNGILDKFNYPQFGSTFGSGNPMDAAGSPVTDVDNNGVIDQATGGGRAGVDLLLANVHEFRIEVWDEILGDFAPIGHGSGIGEFNVGRQLNSTYAPLGGSANIFDTWHPFFDRNFNVPSGTPLGDVSDRPPFRPLRYDPTGVSGVIPQGPTPTAATFVKGYWAPQGAFAGGSPIYNINDVVFPRMEDLNGNGFLDPLENGANGFPSPTSTPAFPSNGLDTRLSEDVNGNGVIDAGESDGTFGFPANGSIDTKFPPYFPFGLTFCYRCIRSGNPGASSLSEPNWPTTPGKTVRDPSGLGPDWICEYNVRPLRAIRITLRFEHPQSKQMKQVTIVHSLRDTTAAP